MAFTDSFLNELKKKSIYTEWLIGLPRLDNKLSIYYNDEDALNSGFWHRDIIIRHFKDLGYEIAMSAEWE